MIWIPMRPPVAPFCSGDIRISPFFAWSTMLRATSEIAAAINVTSAPLKPSSSASDRPRCRAVTMSVAELITVCVSVSIDWRALRFEVQVGKPLFQVQRRAHSFQREAQLYHREGHVGLNADDHRLGA